MYRIRKAKSLRAEPFGGGETPATISAKSVVGKVSL